MEPALRSEQLAGGGLFFDCVTDDARLTLINLLDAQRLGASILNHARCAGFEWEEGPKAVARVEDQLGGDEFKVRAKVVVNASGPWSDHVSRLADAAAPKRLRLTKGAHIVVPRERLGNIRALVLRAPQDNRVFFVVPWDSLSLIGTTDTDFSGEPGAVRADADDVDYLLGAVNHYFPGAALTRGDVVSAYAGLRPLLRSGSGGPSEVSREHALFVGPANFISVVGGKLTTFRRMAHEVVEEAAGHGGLRLSDASTRKRALPGGEFLSANADFAAQRISKDHGMSAEESELLYWLHGSLASEVLQAGGPRAKKRIHPDLPYLNASIVWAFVEEHACSLEDAMVRRVPLALRLRDRGAGVAHAVAEEVAPAAGWSPAEAAAQAEAYVGAARAAYPWRGD
jgi:glycerol-3-phosphate dehydrogenase